MKRILSGPLYGVCALALAATVAACGGGGGGGGSTPPTGGGGGGSGSPAPGTTASPGSTSSPSPSSTPTPSATGQLAINGTALANATVTFTCGCTGEAGETTTDANGNFTISDSATAVPASPAPYVPPGHNILVVGYATNSQTQAWTMQFLGNTPATDLNLGASDSAAAAAALFLYYEAAYNPTIASSNDRTFDWFNFNTIATWTQHLRTAPDSAESKLMNDITAAQTSGQSLFPYQPAWNPIAADGNNSVINADLSAVASGGTAADAALPTPCPGVDQCTGAPTP